MASISDLPAGSGAAFGLDFNYSVWTPGTQVMLANVPWNNDYRDIVKFSSQASLDVYLNENSGSTIMLSNMTYAKPGNPVRINLPFNVCYRFNYLRAFNPAQPIPGNDTGRAFYYFITDIRYIAPNTTEIEIQLDVWQSFNRDVAFGNCYIERGHVAIANEKSFDDNGRDYLTVPEGLDVGGEYKIKKTASYTVGARPETDPTKSFDIIVASTVSFINSGGTIDSPVLASSPGSTFEGIPNGTELYWFTSVGEFNTFIRSVSDKPWITQGIISVTAVPNLVESDVLYSLVPSVLSSGMSVRVLSGRPKLPQTITVMQNWRESILPDRYSKLKKFLTYPYTVVELTTYSGTPLILKPEGMGGTDIEVIEMYHLAPPSPRIAFIPYHYNGSDLPDDRDFSGILHNDNAEFLDMVTGILDLPTFSLVNNGYLSYMAANRNGIAYQYSSADWSQQRALTGNQLSYDQASQSMDLSTQLTGLSVNAQRQQASIANQAAVGHAITGAAGGVAAGIMGGPAGAAGSVMGVASQAASAAIDVNARNQATAVSTGLAQAANRAQVGTAGFMRDTNKSYADFAARGDYENAIAAVNAKVQDARMIQPTVSGQVGGDAFNLTQFEWGVHAKVKVLQGAAMAAIGEYWLRYGYAVSRFGRMPDSLQVMTRFTYWKLRETYLRSSTCPETFRQAIRGIFEKGVTVWSNPADIGMVDIADNDPLPGVSL